jgi:hypothetical protein
MYNRDPENTNQERFPLDSTVRSEMESQYLSYYSFRGEKDSYF